MNVAVNTPKAAGFTPQQTRAQFNQQMAQAHANADMRYNMKPLDRAGSSRAPGQQYMAGIASAQNLADGVAQAYAGKMNDATANAGIGLQNAAADEDLGLGVGAIQQQNQYANALNALQRQQAAYQFQNNILGGLLNGRSSGGWLDNFLGY